MEHLASDNIVEGDIILITSTSATFYKVAQLETTRATTIHVNPTYPKLINTINRLKALPPLESNATIHQILRGNKSNYKCTARIKDIEAHRTWYSVQCSKCLSKLHPQGEKPVEFVCLHHNDIEAKYSYCVNATLIDDIATTKVVFFNDAMANMLQISCKKMVTEGGNTDPQVLPQEMIAHIGQLKTFEIVVQSNRTAVVTNATNMDNIQPIAFQTEVDPLTSILPVTPDPKKLPLKRQHPTTTGTRDNDKGDKRLKTSH
ncbi:uncharacterized protein LOC143616527 [Bidens hawaiensis]|uniref:uncharacterized protein LOC143616527 n=1 Tax=Bidens hawaiensis TaxID=980011 RepID=UPI00404B9E68